MGSSAKLDRIVGRSLAMTQLRARLQRIAGADAPVLIVGETGTGKELCASAIHELGPRGAHRFVPVNCGAIPTELAENELFGHERGAFTHADREQTGLVEEADGGTLFLDEVDALPPAVQVKLLRLLQEGEYRRLGSTQVRRVDLRILAATNASIAVHSAPTALRSDLYFRLSTLSVAVPTLRSRPEDIGELVAFFVAKYTRDGGARVFEPDALAAIMAYDWPGNVRELEQVVRRAIILSDCGPITAAQLELPRSIAPAEVSSFREAKAQVIRRFERTYLESVLRAADGNISHAAVLAKKNRRALWELIRKHRIDVEHFRAPGTVRPAS